MSLKAKMSFKTNFKGLDNLKRRARSASSHVSKVGFWNGTSNDGEMSIASLAFLQEYGRPRTNLENPIPARPFFRISTMNVSNGGSDVRHQMKLALRAIIHGKQTVPESLRKVGAVLEEEIKTTISYFNEPRNAQRTIEIKGADDPLVHTGTLLSSVKNKVTKRGDDV